MENTTDNPQYCPHCKYSQCMGQCFYLYQLLVICKLHILHNSGKRLPWALHTLSLFILTLRLFPEVMVAKGAASNQWTCPCALAVSGRVIPQDLGWRTQSAMTKVAGLRDLLWGRVANCDRSVTCSRGCAGSAGALEMTVCAEWDAEAAPASAIVCLVTVGGAASAECPSCRYGVSVVVAADTVVCALATDIGSSVAAAGGVAPADLTGWHRCDFSYVGTGANEAAMVDEVRRCCAGFGANDYGSAGDVGLVGTSANSTRCVSARMHAGVDPSAVHWYSVAPSDTGRCA